MSKNRSSKDDQEAIPDIPLREGVVSRNESGEQGPSNVDPPLLFTYEESEVYRLVIMIIYLFCHSGIGS